MYKSRIFKRARTCSQAARQYDSAGRMTGNEFAAYGFDAASRINAITQNLYASLVTTTTSGTGTANSTSSQQVNYQLDAAGNLTSDGLRAFDYDTTNRHTKTTVSKDGEASKVTYLHNALGQRVFKSEPQTAQTLPNETVLGTTFTDWLKRNFSWLYATAQTNATLGDSYVYADGNLPSYAMLGEYGNGGASSTGRTEYLYLPTYNGQAIPVGIFRGSRFYAVHADHLNTPRLINDDSNKAVWQWPYSAFGDNKPVGILKATTNPAVAYTQDPTTSARLQATSPTITYNLRFPGQYQDTESGMFQNGFRSLMASQGRYSQSDPIDLQGGWNKFGYAFQNPLTFVDPSGLQVPGSWERIFRGVPPIQVPRSEPETPEFRDCVNGYISNNYGSLGAIVPSFSAYSYLPSSPNFSAAVQSTVISGGAKGVVIPTLIRGGQAAQAIGSAVAPWVSGAGALEAGGVAATALGTAGLWGATAVGSFGAPFSTTAEFMARRECSCRR